MAKDIQEANQSLLKKRKANQTGNQATSPDVKQRLRSMIKHGKIKEARAIALKALRDGSIDYNDDIIRMFAKVGETEFVCKYCKCSVLRSFNISFLSHDHTQELCENCKLKINQEATKQKEERKQEALKRFQDILEDMIDGIIEVSGVPVAFRNARDIIEGVVPIKSYFLKGNVGVGKTYMAVALLYQYLDSLEPEYNEQKEMYFIPKLNDRRPIFIEVPELLLEIRDSYKDKGTMSEKEIVDYYTKTPFLVLDDLGVEKASDFSTLMLYLIINRRCTSGKVTIITSNLSLTEIRDRLSERISSRIKGMCKEITVTGNDKRYENDTERVWAS